MPLIETMVPKAADKQKNQLRSLALRNTHRTIMYSIKANVPVLKKFWAEPDVHEPLNAMDRTYIPIYPDIHHVGLSKRRSGASRCGRAIPRIRAHTVMMVRIAHTGSARDQAWSNWYFAFSMLNAPKPQAQNAATSSATLVGLAFWACRQH